MSTTEMNPIIVQKADTDVLYNHVFMIRTQVFVEESSVDQDDEYDGFDHLAVHYLARYDSQPVGTARWRILPSGDRVRLERFAVLKDFRGKGVGTALVKTLLQEIPKVSEIFIHPQVSTLSFFKRLGFVEEGDSFEEAGIIHKKMVFKGIEKD